MFSLNVVELLDVWAFGCTRMFMHACIYAFLIISTCSLNILVSLCCVPMPYFEELSGRVTVFMSYACPVSISMLLSMYL